MDPVLSWGPAEVCVEDFRERGCNDDSFDLESAVRLELEAGEFISILVDTFAEGTGGNYRLAIEAEQESLDCPYAELGSALGSPVDSGPVPFRLASGGGGDEDACYGGEPRIGFSWTAPHSGVFLFDTFGSSYDTVLSLRLECEGRLYNCNDDAGDGVQSSLSAELSEGQQLLVEVAAFGGNVYSEDGMRASYALNITAWQR
jgi:hypothetical protein